MLGQRKDRLAKKHSKYALLLLLILCIALLVPLAAIAENLFQGCRPQGDSTAAETAAAAFAYHFNTGEHIPYLEGSGDLVSPDAPLTRAQAAKILYTLVEDPLPGEETAFSDVEPGQWYESYVNSMAAMGLLTGYQEGTFLPEKNITRAEFVSALSRVVAPEEGQPALDFSDVDEGHWAYAALKNAVARGWLKGYDGNTLRPDGHITRAEAVTVLNRLLGRSADRAAIDGEGKLLLYLDLPFEHWAYYDILEASVPHEAASGPEGAETWESFSPLPSQREPGYYLESGELYCLGEDGFYLRGASVGVLDFGADGRYTTGNEELDQRLTAIVAAETDPAAPRLENLERLFDYVCANCTYLPSDYVDYGATGWAEEHALAMLQAGNRGNCYSYAGLFTMLARKVGYQAQAISGSVYTDLNGFDVDHGWTEIDEGGQLYFCDTEFEGVYAANRGLDWDLFFQEYGTGPTSYSVNGVGKG